MAFAEYEMEPVQVETPGPESDVDTLYRAGLKFSLGEEVDLDLVEAHKWFNLAAAKGHEVARDLRQEMADQMSQDEIRKAQKAAREWLRLMN
ncbi:MAG: hypothetical protein MRY64_08160 [Hyphomonadaceae bacterium]|nr:hypothetical protein [Hyphomonadaceae bacterium]